MQANPHVFISCCLLAGLTYLVADIFLPSIVHLAVLFRTDVHTLQMATGVTMLALACSQLIFGPLSEAYGRKKLILSGLVICFLGCLLSWFAVLSRNLTLFFTGQFCQGLGLGATALFRALLRDTYKGTDLQKKGNIVSIFNSMVAPGATTLGGIIEVTLGSHYIFIFLMLVILAAIYYTHSKLPDTTSDANLEKAQPAYILQVYRLVMQHTIFRGYCLCTMLTYLSYFIWVVLLPVYSIKFLHWSPDTLGTVMLLTSATAMLSGGYVNKLLSGRIQPNRLMHWGWGIMLTASLSLMLHDAILATNAWMSFAMMMLFQFGTCFLWSNYFIKAFEPFTESAGYASSLYAASQITGSMLAAFIAGYLPDRNLSYVSAVLSVTTVATWYYHNRKIVPLNTTVAALLDDNSQAQELSAS